MKPEPGCSSAGVVIVDNFHETDNKNDNSLQHTRELNNQTPSSISPEEIPDAIHGRRDYFSYGQLLDNRGTNDDVPLNVQPPYGILSSRNPSKNIWRIIAVVIWCGSQGFSDSAPGAILPYIESYYNINYAVVSMIWVSNAAGYILVACFSHKIAPWFGKQIPFTLVGVFSSLMYGIVSSGTKFPVICVAFFLGGIGGAIGNSQANIFLSRLKDESKYLSFYHANYGLFATISPLVATSAINHGLKWHYFYLILLGLALFNLVFLSWAFNGANSDLKPWDYDTSDTQNSQIRTPAGNMNEEIEMSYLHRALKLKNKSKTLNESHSKNMIDALKFPVTWYICFFVLFYQGAEVSIGGWIVTFLLDYRHGNPDTMGYVASGFWGGIAIGRILLVRPLHKKVGIRKGVTVISTCAIICVLLAWIIPNVMTSAIFVSLAGLFIGPNIPLMITLTSIEGLIPRKIQIITLTLMTAFGSSGGAIFPFIVGLMSQAVGTYVVLPVFVGLYSLMLILWICLPNIERRQKYPLQKFSLWQKFW